jgi:deoxyribodipyrimidine photo-lyase
VRGIFWFRNDLRRRDNTGLSALARQVDELVPVFVLDPRLLEGERAAQPRVRFLLDCLARLSDDLERGGCPLVLRQGRPEEEIPRLVEEVRAERVGWNRDYGPFARARDERVRIAVDKLGARVETWKDRVVFESQEVRTRTGGPYAVYTPYRNAWRARWAEEPELPGNAAPLPAPVPSLASVGLPQPAPAGARIPTGGEAAAQRRLARFLDEGLARYAELRDRPDVDGTSRLSPYLHLGAISPRACIHAALERARDERPAERGAQKWVDELIWREFYAGILHENPHVTRGAYRREFDRMRWVQDDEGFAAWCEGRTGFPMVDAAMRQLRATGWMHNRSRMIVASFLTKDLLIDWRRGEAFFMKHLVDGDLASNNGGWQWSASTGTDAQPWFRIFNPTRQGERYDPEGRYVKRWVPELKDLPARFVHAPETAPEPPRGYPSPIVSHAERRQKALRLYEQASGR